jgi:hypothetical protein
MKRFREHEHVEVTLRDSTSAGMRGQFEARILVFSERTVALEALEAADTLRLPELSRGVLLSSLDGHLALRGTLCLDSIPGDLRFAPEAGSARERGTRLPYTLQVAVADDELSHPGLTTLVGPDGVSVCFNDGWAPRGPVTVTIELESTRLPAVTAQALAVTGADGVAELQFSVGSKEARQALGRLAIGLSRLAARPRGHKPVALSADF